MKKAYIDMKRPVNIDYTGKYSVVVPGSKSITNRALLLAAMAEGTSRLSGCLSSDDAVYFLECLKTLGFPVTRESDGKLGENISITGFGGEIPNKEAEIYVGSAGTAARFLVAMLAFSEGVYTVLSSDQMKKRPMQPLIDTLRIAGAGVECLEEEGHFPLKITGIGDPAMIPEQLSVDIGKSSQFLSALLIAAGTFGKKTQIKVTGEHGLAYVDMTAMMMERFGVGVQKTKADGCIIYELSGNEAYHHRDEMIEPDMSAAAYFYAAAAILGISICVEGVTGHMLQGDTQFLEVLEQMGCHTQTDANGQIILQGPSGGNLTGGFALDMSSFSDQALTLSAIAPFADGPVTIRGIGHIRLQECDRIQAIVHNLETLGIRVEEKEDEVTIFPGSIRGGKIEVYDDHRVAMSFALTSLRCDGIRILDPSCCRKTFAQYFEVLEDLTERMTQKR